MWYCSDDNKRLKDQLLSEIHIILEDAIKIFQ